jgi:hypothetical protein
MSFGTNEGRTGLSDREALELWRLADQLSVIEASLLLLSEDPQNHLYIENQDGSDCPKGYEATRNAITRALKSGSIEGAIKPRWEIERDVNGNEWRETIPDSVCPRESTIVVSSLTRWLHKRGLRQGFFFPDHGSTEPYLQPEHPRFARKLYAAVSVWKAVSEPSPNQSVKQTLTNWLSSRAAEFGLTGPDGAPSVRSIEEVAKVANWETAGGAPKTTSVLPSDSAPVIADGADTQVALANSDYDLDDDIPF